MDLENVDDNACIGCGPSNPMGLRLVFAAAPRGATARFVAEARWQGFPGRMHSAVLYLALIETLNWSLYGATKRMGLPTRTSALRMTRRVNVGDEIILIGRVEEHSARVARVVAEATTPNGDAIGSLDRDYDLVDEATFLARMGYDEVPSGYEGVFE